MISVEFRSVGPGACGWCRREKEVYQVAFSDRSFVGALCKGDLMRAIAMKLVPAEPAGKPTPPAVAVSNGPGE